MTTTTFKKNHNIKSQKPTQVDILKITVILHSSVSQENKANIQFRETASLRNLM